MSCGSTTIRVTGVQRDRLRALARQRSSTMTATLDAALDALRREEFYRQMAAAESDMRAHPEVWARYVGERDDWLNAALG